VGQDSRANSYFFSEYNLFENCDDCTVIKSGGVIKSFNDSFVNCEHQTTGTVVTSREQAVSNNNKFPDFDTNALLSYIPSGNYILETDTSKLKSEFEVDGGTMDDPVFGAVIETDVYGDVNGDGIFNIADAVTLQNYLIGRTSTLPDWRSADLSGDDQLDSFDLILIRRSLIEK
ncbi:MAG: dockerin type I repeat-containing protein, partial [Ruminococcus sp.]|nr:dockerin type I repeat-containing protein [Ruminococcus sp.]